MSIFYVVYNKQIHLSPHTRLFPLLRGVSGSYSKKKKIPYLRNKYFNKTPCIILLIDSFELLF